MAVWSQTAWAVVWCVGGVGAALWLERQSKACWMTAYGLSLAVLLVHALERWLPELEGLAPFSWIAGGATLRLLTALIAPILLLTPRNHLPKRPNSFLLNLLTGLMLLSFVVMPALMPALVHSKLAQLGTKMDRDGVCLQQTDYTCGPAAAVTALRKLGLAADEGQMAIWSQTSQYGTEKEELCRALTDHYAKDGLNAETRRFKKVAELHQADIVLAVTKYSFMVDHFVAVLKAANGKVTVADPINGIVEYSEAEFAEISRFKGIVSKRGRQPETGYNASPSAL